MTVVFCGACRTEEVLCEAKIEERKQKLPLHWCPSCHLPVTRKVPTLPAPAPGQSCLPF